MTRSDTLEAVSGYAKVVFEIATKLELCNEQGEFLEMDSLSVIELVLAIERATKLKIPIKSVRVGIFTNVEVVGKFLEELAAR